MLVIGVSDIHGDLESVKKMDGVLSAADVVVLSGDLTTFGDAQEVGRVLDALRSRCKKLFVVPGNCDTPEGVKAMDLSECNLHGRCEIIDGVAFVGIGGSLPCPNKTPMEFSEEMFATLLDNAAGPTLDGAPILLISHQPPHNTCADIVQNGAHVGSASIRAFIEKWAPVACVCGHIHEARGADSIGSTFLVNPGPLREGSYARIEILGNVANVSLITPETE
jgi:Icc-related predicted phosphoesterase